MGAPGVIAGPRERVRGDAVAGWTDAWPEVGRSAGFVADFMALAWRRATPGRLRRGGTPQPVGGPDNRVRML